MFGLLPPVDTSPSFDPAETPGCDVIDWPTDLGFGLHTRAADRWFAGRG